MDSFADLLPLVFLAVYFLSQFVRRRPKPGTDGDPIAGPMEAAEADVSPRVESERPGAFTLEDMLRRLDAAARPPEAQAPLPRVQTSPPARAASRERPAQRPAPLPVPAPPETFAQRMRRPEVARDAFILSTVFERRPNRRR